MLLIIDSVLELMSVETVALHKQRSQAGTAVVRAPGVSGICRGTHHQGAGLPTSGITHYSRHYSLTIRYSLAIRCSSFAAHFFAHSRLVAHYWLTHYWLTTGSLLMGSAHGKDGTSTSQMVQVTR